MTSRTYHHGDLRQELLRQTADLIRETGPGRISLRELARRAGVSHAAPAHHFHDKQGLLTAFATDGFTLLADRLTEALRTTGDLLEVGVAYVEFAVSHRAHFEVMYRPDLYHRDAPELVAARGRAATVLYDAIGTLPEDKVPADIRTGGLAAWSLVHGFATLWLTGALPPDVGGDPAAAGREVARVLFEDRPGSASGGTGRADG